MPRLPAPRAPAINDYWAYVREVATLHPRLQVSSLRLLVGFRQEDFTTPGRYAPRRARTIRLRFQHQPITRLKQAQETGYQCRAEGQRV